MKKIDGSGAGAVEKWHGSATLPVGPEDLLEACGAEEVTRQCIIHC